MPAFRIGLTGGLASGKSTVAKRLAEAGFQVVDADEIVAELYAPGQPGARAVAAMFGANYLDKGGAVDKPRLARLVFADDAARATLEAAIHPLVRASFSRLGTAAAGPADVAPARPRPFVLEATRLDPPGSRQGSHRTLAPVEGRQGASQARHREARVVEGILHF